MSRVDDVREQLQTISEELADVALSLLGQAVSAGEDHERVGMANLERRVTKARRAVEKAINELTD
jgi:NTP pyrophosphatase (non-canonical NTP hydrolase)